jgi:ABC-type transport system involved in cytochrome bd biosynthesis fused ATPase/permease subunit
MLAHARAKRVLEQARAEYEAKSLAWAAIAADLREMRAAARAAGKLLHTTSSQARKRASAESAATNASQASASCAAGAAAVAADITLFCIIGPNRTQSPVHPA